MTKIRRVALIGAGGINSWASLYLKEICDIFEQSKLIFAQIFDEDIVEEKNLLRQNQNYKVEDLMECKAKILGERYGFNYECAFITRNNLSILENFDDIILGVDNNRTRQMLYKFALEHNKYLLDLRAQGTQIMFVTIYPNEQKNMEYYDTRYFNEKTLDRKGGCQLKADIENDHIQNGNKIIAHFGIYGIYLNWLRNEKASTDEFKFTY